jgi:hypothetical protein
MLELPRPRLRAYRPETTIAEKLHAMVALAEANSRMRDFFDVFVLAERCRFEGGPLAEAVRATFERRRTPLPIETPIALTTAFARIDGKPAQWAGFLRRNRLAAAPADLAGVVESIAAFLRPVLAAARSGQTFAGIWLPGGPWR